MRATIPYCEESVTDAKDGDVTTAGLDPAAALATDLVYAAHDMFHLQLPGFFLDSDVYGVLHLERGP